MKTGIVFFFVFNLFIYSLSFAMTSLEVRAITESFKKSGIEEPYVTYFQRNIQLLSDLDQLIRNGKGKKIPAEHATQLENFLKDVGQNKCQTPTDCVQLYRTVAVRAFDEFLFRSMAEGLMPGEFVSVREPSRESKILAMEGGAPKGTVTKAKTSKAFGGVVAIDKFGSKTANEWRELHCERKTEANNRRCLQIEAQLDEEEHIIEENLKLKEFGKIEITRLSNNGRIEFPCMEKKNGRAHYWESKPNKCKAGFEPQKGLARIGPDRKLHLICGDVDFVELGASSLDYRPTFGISSRIGRITEAGYSLMQRFSLSYSAKSMDTPFQHGGETHFALGALRGEFMIAVGKNEKGVTERITFDLTHSEDESVKYKLLDYGRWRYKQHLIGKETKKGLEKNSHDSRAKSNPHQSVVPFELPGEETQDITLKQLEKEGKAEIFRRHKAVALEDWNLVKAGVLIQRFVGPDCVSLLRKEVPFSKIDQKVIVQFCQSVSKPDAGPTAAGVLNLEMLNAFLALAKLYDEGEAKIDGLWIKPESVQHRIVTVDGHPVFLEGEGCEARSALSTGGQAQGLSDDMKEILKAYPNFYLLGRESNSNGSEASTRSASNARDLLKRAKSLLGRTPVKSPSKVFSKPKVGDRDGED